MRVILAEGNLAGAGVVYAGANTGIAGGRLDSTFYKYHVNILKKISHRHIKDNYGASSKFHTKFEKIALVAVIV